MKKLAFAVIILLSFMLINGYAEGQEKGKPVKAKLAHILPAKVVTSPVIKDFGKNVEKETNGRVIIEVFEGGALGSETQTIEQLQMGTIGAVAVAVGTWQYIEPKMAIEDLPYMWKTRENSRNAYDGELGEYLKKLIRGKDLVPLTFIEWGFRHITNSKRPIVKPEDMAGIKIRVAETKLRVDAFKEIGALPIILPWPEVYTALQQGTIDAQENPLTIIDMVNLHEVQKYLSLSEHFMTNMLLVFNKKTWNQFSEKDRQIVMQQALRLRDDARKVCVEGEKTALEAIKKKGMLVNQADKDAFRIKMAPVYKTWGEKVFGKELMATYEKYSGWK